MSGPQGVRSSEPPVLVSRTGVVAFGAALVLFNILLLVALVALWPVGAADAVTPVRLGTWVLFTPAAETRLLLLVIVAGALGSYVHLATSFADYVGNRVLVRSWLMWYALRPFIGTTLAVTIYLAVRGGLLAGTGAAGALSPFGVAALAVLTGMFSKQASDKLREVFENMFRTETAVKREDALTPQAVTTTSTEPQG